MLNNRREHAQRVWNESWDAIGAMLAFADAESAATAIGAGWIVGNNIGQWRTFDSLGWAWTERRDLAIRYARREDAETMHREDEYSWRVEQYPTASLKVASDTDTAIPAGEVDYVALRRRAIAIVQAEATEMGYCDDYIADFAEPDGDDLLTVQAVERALAASPKPDTDTHVDPGVEGVREALIRGLVEAGGHPREYASHIRDDDRFSLGTFLAALAAKPIAGMDAGEVEQAVARIGRMIDEEGGGGGMTRPLSDGKRYMIMTFDQYESDLLNRYERGKARALATNQEDRE